MSEQETLQQIHSVLDQVYALSLMPVKGINRISEIMANVPKQGEKQ